MVVQFLMNHGLALLFISVLAGQAGIPIPNVPVLIAVGALANIGHTNPILSIIVALIACITADVVWYEVGRRGRSINLLRRGERSLKVRNRMRCALGALNHHRVGVLFLAKYLPGPNLASPLAGMSGISPSRFLFIDSIASVVWVGGYVTIGYFFSQQLQRITAHAAQSGWVLLVVVACVFAAVGVVPSLRRNCSQWRRLRSVLAAAVLLYVTTFASAQGQSFYARTVASSIAGTAPICQATSCATA